MQFAESSSLWDRSFRPVQTHQEISAEGVAKGELQRGGTETQALAFEQSCLTPRGFISVGRVCPNGVPNRSLLFFYRIRDWM